MSHRQPRILLIAESQYLHIEWLRCSLRKFGAEVVDARPSSVNPHILANIDGIVLPGDDTIEVPEAWEDEDIDEDFLDTCDDDSTLVAHARAFLFALRNRVPTLGICRGAQLINVLLGGTLVRAPFMYDGHLHRAYDKERAERHRFSIAQSSTKIEPGSTMAYFIQGAPNKYGVVCLHFQGGFGDSLGSGLRTMANTAGVIEAFEHEKLPVLGMQFHPEGMDKTERDFLLPWVEYVRHVKLAKMTGSQTLQQRRWAKEIWPFVKDSPVDSHVHFFDRNDLSVIEGPLPYQLPRPHRVKDYLDRLDILGIKPSIIANVHLSILPNSDNVFRSFSELEELQRSDPDRYKGITMIGTLVADPQYATEDKLKHPQVKGVRIVLHDKTADAVSDSEYLTSEYNALFARLRNDQHVHIFGKRPSTILKVVRQIPEHVTIAIDHLGTCFPYEVVENNAHISLLQIARMRGNVYFKGPGYRTDITPQAVVPIVERIIAAVGPQKVVLSASDAPHVGKNNDGRPYSKHFTPSSAFAFARTIAEKVAENGRASVIQLLHDNFLNLLRLEQSKQNDVVVVKIPIQYADGERNLSVYIYMPKKPSAGQPAKHPVLFVSGFTGGVSMYGRLMADALTDRGHPVVTYDVAGFYSNADVKNRWQVQDGSSVTRVSIIDQKQEVEDIISWCRAKFGSAPVLVTWAMGCLAGLQAIISLKDKSKPNVPLFIPMQYSSMHELQKLRSSPRIVNSIMSLPAATPIPVFDLGTSETILGFYPLDIETQRYTSTQLREYTAAMGVQTWPGCDYISAGSLRECLNSNVEEALRAMVDEELPMLFPIHGHDNTLHNPEETKRLFAIYPGQKAELPILIQGLQHGQQMERGNDTFKTVISLIEEAIESFVVSGPRRAKL